MSVDVSQIESGYHSGSRAGDGANSNDSGVEEGGGGGGGSVGADVTAKDVREALLRRGGEAKRVHGGEDNDKDGRGGEGDKEEEGLRATVADAVDILKLSFILQAIDNQQPQGELGCLPSSASQEFSGELKRSLRARPAFQACSLAKTAASVQSDSKSCEAGPPLGDLLSFLLEEDLLYSLLPQLAAGVAVSSGDAADKKELTGEVQGGGSLGSKTKRRGEGGGNAAAETGGGRTEFAMTATSAEDHSIASLGNDMSRREVTIHVCDDNRDVRRDFTCGQDLLLEQMGYFRDITAGQSLEDVDISVHCDVDIFEWLMLWIKSTGSEDKEDLKGKPELLPSNVMSILVSASFLKIHELVDEALKYAHANMAKILAVMPNFNCLGEPLFSKLAYLFKASEVEDLPDRRDRLQSRLYVKLIYALFEPLPQPERDIFYTGATLHRCRACGLVLTQAQARLLPCAPHRARVSQRGEVVPRHQRDPNFNANDFVRSLKSEVRSWRRVFWRLWGLIHPLYCSLCSSYFPCHLLAFCPFHPQDADFPTIQFKNSTEPFGRFPCCDSPAVRYAPVAAPPSAFCPSGIAASSSGQAGPGRGCQSRDHRIKIRTDQEKSIYRVLMAHRDAICLSSNRKSGIKIACDVNSVTLPKPGGTNSDRSQQHQHQHQQRSQDDPRLAALLPGGAANVNRRKRSLVKSCFWTVAIQANPMLQIASGMKMTNSSSSLCTSTFGSAALSSASSVSNMPTLNSLAQPVKFKLAARRWRNFTYGRLKRAPKMPVKQQSSESSSAASTEDLSEDSSSSGLEDEEEARMEYDMDSKDLCIEIKIAKGQAGTGADRNRLSGNAQGQVNVGKYAPSLSYSNTLHPNDTPDGAQSPGGRRGKEDQNGNGKNTMWWDGERSVRANQDNQRELECSAFRTMVKLSKLRPNTISSRVAKQPGTPSTPLRSPYATDGCSRPAFLGPGFSSPSATLTVANASFLSASSSSHNLLMSSASRGGGGWQGGGAATGAAGLTSSASVPSLTSLAAPERPAAAAAAAAAGGGGAFLRLEQDWRETHVAYLQHRSAVSSCSSGGGPHLHHHGMARAATPSSLGIPGRSPASHHHRPGSAASTKSNRTIRTHR